MRSITLVTLLLCSNLFGQECLIDGKDMYSIGSSEIVNGELLSLFRCDEGHQMWLSNYDEENANENVITKTIDMSQPELDINSGTVSLLANVIESENISLISEGKPTSVPITKIEKVLKTGSASASFTSDISIKKFGVETLLHKKIESDRVFAESIEEEKNELLYIMNAHKRLFEMTNGNKYKFNPFKNPFKFSIYTGLSLILILSL